MVVSLSGWVDAGMAGAGTVAALREQLVDADEFTAIDLSDHMDLQQTRPERALDRRRRARHRVARDHVRVREARAATS